jgi:hypothetical protein
MASGQPTVAALKGRPIGRILIKMGKVTRAQVSRALELQKSKKKGLPLGELLIEMGDVTKRTSTLRSPPRSGGSRFASARSISNAMSST